MGSMPAGSGSPFTEEIITMYTRHLERNANDAVVVL